MKKLEKYKPAVKRNFLLLIAGIVWECVGIMLLILAFSWLSASSNTNIHVIVGAGVVFALLAHHFGFLRIADKNLNRILPMDEKKCLFSFISWKSYLVIVVMISMGVLLRHSTIPKKHLAILYIGIGLALILSSIRYMRFFYKEIKREN